MPELAFVNGRFTPIAEATVSIEDRGMQFGDGVYEVIVAYDGRLFQLESHMQRLRRSAAGIGLDYDFDGKPLEEAVGQSVGYLAGGQDYWLKMEAESLLPGFSEALEGAVADEKREFSLTVPEEFPVEELRGLELAYAHGNGGIIAEEVGLVFGTER